MFKYRFSNKAIEDLAAIWDYTYDTWSEEQADKYYNMLILFCEQLAGNPSLGKRYDEIKENLLGFRAGKHIIFYMIISKSEIDIIRILHQQMDLRNRITE